MSTVTNRRRRIYEMCIFAMLGAIMFCSDLIMELLPNIHLVGVLTMVYTLVFRAKALIPIYVYVFLCGVLVGFDPTWTCYLYAWTILWGVTMLLPKRMSKKVSFFVYPVFCALHGLSFGTLCTPVFALAWGFGIEGVPAWIVKNIPFDLIHAAGNFVLGFLILPLSELMKKLNKKIVG